MSDAVFFVRLKDIDVTAARFFCFVAAVGVYALLGSPTPDRPGAVEIIVAALLLCAISIPSLYAALRPQTHAPLWKSSAQFLLVYGLSLSLVSAVLQAREPVQIARDVVPFLFLLLPLFLQDIFQKRPELARKFVLIIVLLGLVFSLRAAPEVFSWWHPGIVKPAELHYFANAPGVLFAALFLAGAGLSRLSRRFSAREGALAVICLLLALAPLGAVALTLQRASLAFFALYILALTALGFYRHPFRALAVLAVLCAALWPAADIFIALRDVLGTKTGLVGFNMRGAELAAVLDGISVSPATLFFGTGWGGTFESPAVAGIRVNYTHSLVSGILLKTGLVGVTLLLFYLAGLAQVMLSVIRRDAVLGLALAGPIFIDVFLYASHKSLDFGLILLLLTAAGAYTQGRKVASVRRLLYSKPYSRSI